MSDQSMVATRARRANAGSRLKQLIEIEEQSSEARTMVFANDDDENVQLLFQEDENDGEFEESNPEESEEESENERDTDDVAGQLIQSTDNVEENLDVETNVNSDEMLSDSELSASDDDESEGERELQKQEKSKKRKKGASTIIPAIKKPKVAKPKQAPKPEVKHLEILLQAERRASSRKSAIRNKQELVQRLKEDESRRATFIPVARVKERELTQEERLKEAKETERANIASLHLFMEQEIVKKERQKLLFQQRRLQLRNVIRLYSTESYVTPLEEVEDDRHVRDMFEKKRRGRRRKNISEEPEVRKLGDIDTELPYYRQEMEIKRLKELEEEEKRRQLEAARAEKRRKIEQEREERKQRLEEERLARKKAKEERLKEFEDVDLDSVDAEKGEDSKFLGQEPGTEAEKSANEINEDDGAVVKHPDDESVNEVSSTASPIEIDDGVLMKEDQLDHPKEGREEKLDVEQCMKPTSESPLNPCTGEESEKGISSTIPKDDTSNESPSQSLRAQEDEDGNVDEGNEVINEESIGGSGKKHFENSDFRSQSPMEIDSEAEEKIKSETTGNVKSEVDEEKKEKKVTFADADEDSNLEEQQVAEKEKVEGENKLVEVSEGRLKLESEFEESQTFRSAPSYVSDTDGAMFQGPAQRVARNLIFLIDFDEEERWGLSELKMKNILFGENANLGPSRRFREVETILKSSLRSENPYAAPKEEKEDELLIPVTELTEESAMFDAITKLPRLGTKEIFEEEEIDESKEETTEIQIRTEAPTGLYLPNGNKKLCLISGKEVRYFDPVTGVPYENKEVYQIIKTIELGHIPWYSLGKDQNTYGPVEIFLNNREHPRHAKGVPEGFDGF